MRQFTVCRQQQLLLLQLLLLVSDGNEMELAAYVERLRFC